MKRDLYRLRQRWGSDLFGPVPVLAGVLLAAVLHSCGFLSCERTAIQRQQVHTPYGVLVRRVSVCED